jgi:para-nitrobenzyl esterase
MTSVPVVETTAGKVRGSLSNGIHVFKGVPYGASTTGANRFMPPVPPEAWVGVREVTSYGQSCAQPFGDAGEGPQEERRREIFALHGIPLHEDPQGEDCLVLNVWTPGLGDGGRRPVLVRIHGGGFVMGSGSWGWHDGTNLAGRGDVVVVTVNHRLGALGYLHLAEIGGAAYAHSGNAGMLDLVVALEWVRDNIEAFGGDPGNVMIFGESGGGYKVSTLLAMPGAQGLFHRAIIQSGPGLAAMTPNDATAAAKALLDELGLDATRIGELHAMPVERVLEAQLALARRTPGMMGGAMGFAPVLDDEVLPSHPGDALDAGASSAVPLMIGSTREEATFFLLIEGMATGGPIPIIDDEALTTRVTMMAGERAGSVIDTYRATMPGASPLDLYVRIMSDAVMRMGSITLAERKLAGGSAPVFMYMMAWASPAMDGFFKATHGLCVALSMDNCDSAPMAGDYPASSGVAAHMSDAWIAFARHGDPNRPDLPKWSPYSLDERATMIFDEECTVLADPYREQRLAWQP